MKAIRVHTPGGPEVLRYEDAPVPEPQAGEALVRLEAIGINFLDVYHRTGLYKRPLPFTPGAEGAGTVTAVAPGVTEVAVGDRVAYAGVAGSYAEQVVAPVAQLVKLPAGIDAETAAAAMLQGMTAHYLVGTTYPLRAGETALVHGARVIGTVSTERLWPPRHAGDPERAYTGSQSSSRRGGR